MKKKTRWVDEKQAILLFEKRGLKADLKQMARIHHGELFLRIQNTETNVETSYVMQRIFFKPFDLAYSCTPGIKKGRELLISNMRLPRGPVVIK
jgi:hypothetical protein